MKWKCAMVLMGALVSCAPEKLIPFPDRTANVVMPPTPMKAAYTREAAGLCASIRLCTQHHIPGIGAQEQEWELPAEAAAEVKDILRRVQGISEEAGICATPGSTTRIMLIHANGSPLLVLNKWEIAADDTIRQRQHASQCTLSLPRADYDRLQILITPPEP